MYIEFPEAGMKLNRQEECGDIETQEKVFRLCTPVSGDVVEINREVDEDPELVNDDPHFEGWLIKIQMSNADELNDLMSADQYKAFLETNDY